MRTIRTVSLILLMSLASGVTITLTSGFYRQELSFPGRTNIGYGLPTTWHGISGPVVYPEIPGVDWFSWESFAFDVVFWALIIGGATAVAFRWFKAKEYAQTKKKERDYGLKVSQQPLLCRSLRTIFR